MLGQGESFCFCKTHVHYFPVFAVTTEIKFTNNVMLFQYFTDLHILVVLLKSFILYWSEATRRNCSAVRGGYQVMHFGTALCSMRSELKMRSLFTPLFSRSYSTYYSVPHKHKEVCVLNIWHKKKTVSQNIKPVHTPMTKKTNQSAVHSQREQSGLGAVQVNPKKKVFDGLVVGVVSAYIHPARQRAFIVLQP